MPVDAIDFSDLTESKSKSPQPQPNTMGYPTQQTGNGDELLQLFPTPLLICPYPVDYTKELEWIRNQECRKENTGSDPGQGKIHYNSCLLYTSDAADE